MNGVACNRAIARGGEAYAQSRRGRGADVQICISEGLVRQSVEVDRLVRLRDAKASRHAHRRVVIRIPDRKSTRLNSSHVSISYAVFCLKKKRIKRYTYIDNSVC